MGGQGDHGVDLIADKDGTTSVVQCKINTGIRSVGEPQVRDLYGAMHHYQASRAILISAGHFTDEARAWAQGKAIDLWDVETLAAFAPKPATHREPGQATALVCERCGSALVERRNRSTGEGFYGCTRFPNCRYTRPI